MGTPPVLVCRPLPRTPSPRNNPASSALRSSVPLMSAVPQVSLARIHSCLSGGSYFQTSPSFTPTLQ
ncbi:hypothetical protein AVEN_33991-1 [Araneus ventricosus]|uniref:Uncharacterized protein n=1 Tax=Araneus ventricosus TaxID=182803 RepID=A0A4Y2E4G3_ARAVE|nr:hypothetical protein AVEN_33991-1 [Araneus ventricosus]